MAHNRINRLKEQLKKKAIISTALLACIAGIFLWVSNTELRLQQYNQNLIQELSQLASKISDVKQLIIHAGEARDFWKNSAAKLNNKDGLDIDQLKHTINYLHHSLNLASKVDIILSDPVTLTGPYQTNTTKVMSSQVKLELSGISDEELLRFIDAIAKNTSGFITWQSLQINKNFEYSDKLIKQIEIGESLEVVSLSVTFLWQDFKDVKP
ncbi:MAG: hypothetical protein RIT35_1486 [Pseudomonadota bacterium]